MSNTNAPRTITDFVLAESEIESLRQQRNDLLEAVDNLSNVKGRHNTEIAWRRMADLVAKLKATREQGK